jgi:hypothetical protein
MMGVDDVGVAKRRRQSRRQGMGDVAVKQSYRAQGAQAQASRLSLVARVDAEGDQLAIDLSGHSSGQLERIPLAAAQQPLGRAERRRSYVNDAHAGGGPDNPG